MYAILSLQANFLVIFIMNKADPIIQSLKRRKRKNSKSANIIISF